MTEPTKSLGETPRMDDAADHCRTCGLDFADLDLARQLERELAQAQKENAELKKDAARLTGLIGMLYERSLHFRTSGNLMQLCNNSAVLGEGVGANAAIDAALKEPH